MSAVEQFIDTILENDIDKIRKRKSSYIKVFRVWIKTIETFLKNKQFGRVDLTYFTNKRVPKNSMCRKILESHFKRQIQFFRFTQADDDMYGCDYFCYVIMKDTNTQIKQLEAKTARLKKYRYRK